MASFTRRTHVVRVRDPNSSGNFADVEVLDAIAYRNENNKEEILDLVASNSAPFIVDETGGGNGAEPNEPTRRSHMKRVINRTDPSQKFDVEVLDVIAFRGENGEEWILDMGATSDDPDAFSLTDGGGSARSTRRTHTEKISPDPTDKKPGQFISIERCDAMAFRSINGQEMILSNPSNDDPRSIDPRASTHVTPEGYNATDDGPTPPDNKDPSVYFSFVKGANGCFTGDEVLRPGPLWWIRRIVSGEILVIRVDLKKKNLGVKFEGSAAVTPQTARIRQSGNFGKSATDIEKRMNTYPVMPRTAADGVINMKTDDIWWTGSENTTVADNWTTLFFLNVAKITKADANGELKFTLQLPELQKPGTSGGVGVGRYIWAVSGGDAFTYVPIHAPPDRTNAFSPYPFTDVATSTYISLWNNSDVSSIGNFASRDPITKEHFDRIGFQPSDFPAANGAYGFATDGGASAWASALTAFNVADKAAAEAAAAANHINITFPPPTVYVPLIIDFSGGGASVDTPALTTVVTAMDFVGKLAFARNALNIPAFAAPTSPDKNVTATFAHAAAFAGSLITVLMKKDAQGKYVITITESVPPV